MDKNCHLDKNRVLGFIEDAKGLIKGYDRENELHPNTHYDYGSVDEVALNLMEREHDFILIGVTLRGDDIHLHGRPGRVLPDGSMYAYPSTITYVLQDFTGTTIARFAHTLCDVLCSRANSENDALRQLMMSPSYARRTRKELQAYLPQS